MQDDAKPVAWMYENEEGSKELILNCNSEYARRLLEFGWTETPLYAHPPAPAQPADVERVRFDAPFPAAMQADAAPIAVGVTAADIEAAMWAYQETTDCGCSEKGIRAALMSFAGDTIIEADRATLQAHADALAGALNYAISIAVRQTPKLDNAEAALRAYREFRD